MPNISVTSVCNRICAYCFAKPAFDKRGSASGYMSPSVFQKALDLMERSRITQVRILGGEPTLHPDFSAMIDQVLKRKLNLLVFSNGLMPEKALKRLEKISTDRLTVLANVAPPSGNSIEEQRRQAVSFRRLGSRVSLGLNIYSPSIELDFMLDLIKEFGLSRYVRLGLAQPGLNADNAYLNPRYYSHIGRKITEFAKRAAKEDVKLRFDCGFVPCMFPEESRGVLGNIIAKIGLQCTPTLDILPDGSIISCYPLSGMYSEAVNKSCDADELRARFETELKPYREMTIFRECDGCELRKNGHCLGGCLALAMQRLHKTPFSVSVQ